MAGGGAGLVASVLYLTSQGDILATAVPDFPVWDLAVLRRPLHRPAENPGVTDPAPASAPTG